MTQVMDMGELERLLRLWGRPRNFGAAPMDDEEAEASSEFRAAGEHVFLRAKRATGKATLKMDAKKVALAKASAQLKRAAGKRLAPHSPYFGPGYWASLQLAAAIDGFEVFEFLYVRPEAWCGLDPALPACGAIRIPDKPGIGFEPDMSVIERYRV